MEEFGAVSKSNICPCLLERGCVCATKIIAQSMQICEAETIFVRGSWSQQPARASSSQRWRARSEIISGDNLVKWWRSHLACSPNSIAADNIDIRNMAVWPYNVFQHVIVFMTNASAVPHNSINDLQRRNLWIWLWRWWQGTGSTSSSSDPFPD